VPDAATVLCLAVTIRACTGKSDEAKALFEELLGIPDIGREPEFAFQLGDMVRTALRVGLPEVAGELIGICEELTPLEQHALQTADALVLEHRRDLEAAAEAFEDAASRWRQFGVPWEEAQAQLGVSRCLHQLGRLSVQDHLRAARTIFERLGAGPAVAETDALLARVVASAS
jgi:hypothetical protein